MSRNCGDTGTASTNSGGCGLWNRTAARERNIGRSLCIQYAESERKIRCLRSEQERGGAARIRSALTSNQCACAVSNNFRGSHPCFHARPSQERVSPVAKCSTSGKSFRRSSCCDSSRISSESCNRRRRYRAIRYVFRVSGVLLRSATADSCLIEISGAWSISTCGFLL